MALTLSGFHAWLAGEVVTASNLLNYLMSQTPMHFASTAARDAALTGTYAPSEGVMVWVDATIDVLYRYDGSAWTVIGARGSGSPEGVVTANIGAFYERTDGSTSTTFYVKESGTGTTGWVAHGGSSIPANDFAIVETSQSTTSTSPADLSTAGPAVTVTTGTKALVICKVEVLSDTAGSYCYVGAAVSGATTIAANAANSARGFIRIPANSANYEMPLYPAIILGGLTAGSNTFTMKYWVSANTGTFAYRRISVVNLA